MKIIAHINADTTEGREIIAYLKKFPDVVTFPSNAVNEPTEEYTRLAILTEDVLSEDMEKAPTHRQVFSKLLDDLSEDYGIDMHAHFKL
ncbi:MAG TPA: hypothetical protein DDW85_04970 [Porphyromonadaceae bacterium]|mgnify:FL=1|nr:hypothetical protein [Porphyromonadaceae bacterium]